MSNQATHAAHHEHDNSVQIFLLHSKHYLYGTEMKVVNTQNNKEEKHGDTDRL